MNKITDEQREKLKSHGVIPLDFTDNLNNFKEEIKTYLAKIEEKIGLSIPFKYEINEDVFFYSKYPEYYTNIDISVYLHPTKKNNYNSIFPDGICLEPLRIQDYNGFIRFKYLITQDKNGVTQKIRVNCYSMQNIDISRINFAFTGCNEISSNSEYVILTSKYPMGKNIDINWTDQGRKKLSKILEKTINNVKILKDCYKPVYDNMNSTVLNDLKLLKIAQKKYNINTNM